LMELGALVCTPQSPRCDACPLTAQCSARRQGLQEEIPLRTAPSSIEETREAAVVVRRGDKFLLVQRPPAGRWANMWEVPHRALTAGERHDEAARRLIEEWTHLRADLGPEWRTVRHRVTRFRITMVCFEARYRGGRFASPFYQAGRWVKALELENFPVSTPQRRLMSAVGGIADPHRQTRFF